jgi:hypothetical protein
VSLDLGPTSVVNALGSAVVLALGLYVARIRPRRRANVAFAAFSVLWGYVNVVSNLLKPDDALSSAVYPTWIPAEALAGAALVLVGLWFPRRLARRERRLLLLPLAMALFLLGSAAVLVLTLLQAFLAAIATLYPAPLPPAVLAALLFVDFSFDAMFVFILVLLPLRAGAAPERAPERRQLPLVAAAMALYPGMVFGHQAPCGASAECALGFGIGVLPFATAAALWLRNASRAHGAEARGARDAALATLGALVAGGLAGAALGTVGPQYGLARLLMVALLAYAILRHQLLGIDVKVKWTLKQSTVAAAFIGVFFVVSESAASFLSGSVGPYLGIAAAGLLVFALAPLQHAAQRVADRAMPGVKAAGAMSRDERAQLFRAMAGSAWADGTLTRDERRMLGELREELGLSTDEAERIEREVARA